MSSADIFHLSLSNLQVSCSDLKFETYGARPTNDISIEFEIQPKFAVLWFEIYSTDHNDILHTSRQLHCRDVCKMSLW